MAGVFCPDLGGTLSQLRGEAWPLCPHWNSPWGLTKNTEGHTISLCCKNRPPPTQRAIMLPIKGYSPDFAYQLFSTFGPTVSAPGVELTSVRVAPGVPRLDCGSVLAQVQPVCPSLKC